MIRPAAHLAPCRPIALLAALAIAAMTARSASADLIVTAQTVVAQAGSTNNILEVDLTNTGTTAVGIGGFSFGLTVAGNAISFTAADISTPISPYIFAGHSAYGPVISTTPPPSGQAVIASDSYDVFGSGIMLAAGGTVGLGRVLFDVAPGTPLGASSVVVTSFPATSLSNFAGGNVAITRFQNGSITIVSPSTVPEPASFVLLACGLVGFAARRRRKGRPA